jgi:hypothetical protein
VTDQFFLVEKLEGAIPLHIDSVPKVAVNRWEHGNDHAHLMVVGCFIDLVANCKLRHRKLLLEEIPLWNCRLDFPPKVINASLSKVKAFLWLHEPAWDIVGGRSAIMAVERTFRTLAHLAKERTVNPLF